MPVRSEDPPAVVGATVTMIKRGMARGMCRRKREIEDQENAIDGHAGENPHEVQHGARSRTFAFS